MPAEEGGGAERAAPAAPAESRPAAADGGYASTGNDSAPSTSGIVYRQYRDERDLPAVMELIDRDLSEPYSIFTYRYFVAQWPKLCFLAVDPTGGAARAPPDDAPTPTTTSDSKPPLPPVLLPDNEGAAAGVVVCKAEPHRDRGLVRGYLAMLVVDRAYRGKKLGVSLAKLAIAAMRDHPCDELALEAEAGNKAALSLYRSLGFVRDKRLHRYYLNGADAYRLKLLLPKGRETLERQREERFAQGAGMVGEGVDGNLEEGEEERRAADEAAEALAGLEVAAA